MGPNGNYWESLKALRLVSRMPARAVCPLKTPTGAGNSSKFLGPQKTTNNLKPNLIKVKDSKQLKKPSIGYWIVPIGLPQHPKHPSLRPTSIPIPTPASDHPQTIFFSKLHNANQVLIWSPGCGPLAVEDRLWSLCNGLPANVIGSSGLIWPHLEDDMASSVPI